MIRKWDVGILGPLVLLSGSYLIAHPVCTGLFGVSRHHYDASRRFSIVGCGDEFGFHLAISDQDRLWISNSLVVPIILFSKVARIDRVFN